MDNADVDADDIMFVIDLRGKQRVKLRTSTGGQQLAD